MNPKVNFYFEKAGVWQSAVEQLRTILLDTGLSSELKWGCPCYTLDVNNIALIHTFKAYCAVLFFKGALMNDSENLLIQQTENVQSTRQMRFTSLHDVLDHESILRAYLKDAINVEKSGQKVELKKTREYSVPEELTFKMEEVPAFKEAFYALTPGRQRGYLLHFAGAKQSQTRSSRIEKAMPDILAGKGLNDR